MSDKSEKESLEEWHSEYRKRVIACGGDPDERLFDGGYRYTMKDDYSEVTDQKGRKERGWGADFICWFFVDGKPIKHICLEGGKVCVPAGTKVIRLK